MTQEVAQAINNVTKRLNEMEQKLDNYFLMKHEENKSAITDTDMAIMELAGLIENLSQEEEQK